MSYSQVYYIKNREKIIAYNRTWRNKNRERWRKINRENVRKQRAKNPVKTRAMIKGQQRKRTIRRRYECLVAYGGNPPKCQCCGENKLSFLTLDHINGGGRKHMREIGVKRTHQLYGWLIRNNFPPILRVLCWNCNCGRQLNKGVCPHLDG